MEFTLPGNSIQYMWSTCAMHVQSMCNNPNKKGEQRAQVHGKIKGQDREEQEERGGQEGHERPKRKHTKPAIGLLEAQCKLKIPRANATPIGVQKICGLQRKTQRQTRKGGDGIRKFFVSDRNIANASLVLERYHSILFLCPSRDSSNWIFRTGGTYPSTELLGVGSGCDSYKLSPTKQSGNRTQAIKKQWRFQQFLTNETQNQLNDLNCK